MTMNFKIVLAALMLAGVLGTARAGDTTVTITASGASIAGDASAASDASSAGQGRHHHKLHGGQVGSGDQTRISIGHNQMLPAGEHADNVVSVLGSSIVAGDVSEDVVAVLGNLRITGPVSGDVVAVMGNTYIDSKVGGDVVDVMGNIELGPNAEVGGEINAVGGSVVRNPAAVGHGDAVVISTGMEGLDFAWLQNWVTNCLFKGRLLAFTPGLGWAWTVALISLLFYVLAALLMPRSVEKYVEVLENHPGESLLAAFLTLLATPVLIVLLCITFIGILAIPFLGLALILAGSFGRIVLLAWIGTRLVKPIGANAPWSHPAAAVLIGGLIVTVLYTVPVIGMIMFQLIGFIGMGVVVYGLLLTFRDKRQSNGAPPQQAAAPQPDTAPEVVAPTGPSAVPSASVAAMAAVSYPRAGFWIRMFALLIDALLVSIIVHLVMHANHSYFWVLLAAYGAAMWKFKGATLGGMIFHLHVVRLDGREVDWSTAIVRSLACFLSLIIAGLGFIWIAVDGERQGWHDKIAGTVVVRVPKGVSLV